MWQHKMIVLALAVQWSGFALAQPQLPVTRVEPSPVERLYWLDGVVEAEVQSTVSARTSGRIERIAVDVDDVVEKGALLVQLDDLSQRSDLDQAQASLAEARARRDEAETESARARNLKQRNLAAQSELDRAEATRKAAEARLEAAQAALARAREELNHTRITAPYTGVVTARHVEIGELARPGTPLLSGLSLEQLRVLVRVPQRYVEAVRNATYAEVRGSTGATVRAIDWLVYPVAETQSNSFKVRVRLPAGVAGMAPGTFTKVAFALPAEPRLMVPRAAVAYRSELTAVYVARDGTYRLRQVRLGRVQGDSVEVLAGLEAGEEIVLDPVAAGIALKRAAESR